MPAAANKHGFKTGSGERAAFTYMTDLHTVSRQGEYSSASRSTMISSKELACNHVRPARACDSVQKAVRRRYGMIFLRVSFNMEEDGCQDSRLYVAVLFDVL
jgi:hypothetical protein